MSSVVIEAAAIVLLILVNGYFALSEMAVVAARKVRLAARVENGKPGARAALELKQHTDRFFSTAQIGITLVGILTGAFSGATIAQRLQAQLALVPALEPFSGPLSLALVVLPVTFLTLILGELVPKQLAVNHPERMSRLTAPFMRLLMRLTLPVVHLLSATTRLVVGLLRIKPASEPNVTEEDIRGLIKEAVLYGEVQRSERDMLERIFRLGDRLVGSLMTRRNRIVWLDINAPEEEILDTILEHPHSRFPVSEDGQVKAVGVVRAKDYLGACLKNGATDLKEHLLPPLVVQQTMHALHLLELFRGREQMHFALVVNEQGETRGLVTFNDILEAIVGDTQPAAGKDEPAAVQRVDGSWLLDGFMLLEDIREILPVTLQMEDEGENIQDLAGFVRIQIGHVPRMGEYFDWEGHRFEVVDMDGRRIDRILVRPSPEHAREG
ncbi:MAG: hemolysin family protein [Desulfovibrionales bacterium]